MLEHFHIFYCVVTLFIGSISCIIGILFYIKTKEKLILYYLYFYCAYTLMIFLGLFDLYTRINIPDLPSVIEHVSSYFMEFPVFYSLLFTIPFFSHYLFQVPAPNIRNKILTITILFAFIIQHFTEMVLGGIFDSIGDMIEDALLILVILYSVVIGILYYRKLPKTTKKIFAFYYLVLLCIYSPGVIVDTFFDGFFYFEFYPILYCGFSLICTILLIKYFTHIPLEKIQSTVPQKFIDRYNISIREAEILSEILQGKSNKNIGDKLFISQSTVKTHISNIFEKCNVKNRYALITLISNTT